MRTYHGAFEGVPYFVGEISESSQAIWVAIQLDSSNSQLRVVQIDFCKRFNDAFSLYDSIGYPGEHRSLPNKRETFSVEGDNAELRNCRNLRVRHYLAHLARRSRCYSRRLEALAQAVDLFVMAWNRRQRFNAEYPHYRRNLIEFITPI